MRKGGAAGAAKNGRLTVRLSIAFTPAAANRNAGGEMVTLVEKHAD
ncbi:MAG: hypothetical protein ACHQCF_01840 [Solirubrobacterales bacterium]